MNRAAMMLGCALLLALPAGAQADETLSLDAAVHLALARAPGFQAERMKRAIAAEDVRLARAWLLPYVEAGGGWSYFEQRTHYDRPLPIPLRERLNGHKTTLRLRLVQALFRLDRWAAWQESRMAAQAAETALQLARQALVLEVASRYEAAIAAGASLRAAARKRKALEKAAAMARARMAEGLATRPQALAAQSRAQLAGADWLAARQARDVAVARLESLIGKAHPPLPSMPPPLPEQWRAPSFAQEMAQEKTPEAILERAQAHALPVRLARIRHAIAREEVTRAWGGALPKVDLVAGVSRERTTDGLFGAGSLQRNESIGIEVSVPIYAGGGTWAQLRKSEKQRIEAGFRLEDARRQARLEAQEAWLRLRSARARRASLQSALAAARAARDAAARAWQEGLTDAVALMDAESRVAEARSALANARAGEAMAALQLRAAIGDLDGGGLADMAQEDGR